MHEKATPGEEDAIAVAAWERIVDFLPIGVKFNVGCFSLGLGFKKGLIVIEMWR